MDKLKISSLKTPLLVTALILLCCFAVYKNYLLHQYIFFFKGVGSDTLNCSYPFIYHIAEYIAKYGIPGWSFKFGMGQSIFPFFLRDPFDIFLYAAGKDHIQDSMVYKEVLKIVANGLIFFYYLRMLKLSKYTSVIGSLLFSFCGFMIVGGCWSIFSFEAFNMALLLLSFELLFTRQKWHLFPFAIALICISQPFNLYVYGVFLAAYTVLRHIQTNTFTVRSVSHTFFKMICFGMIGMMISAPFLIQNVMQLLESPRGGGSNSYAESLLSSPVFKIADKSQLGTCVFRFFSNDILGHGTEFFGWRNFLEAPLFYCGLPCLLLLPQLFGFLERRLKISFLVFLGIWLLPVIFPYFRYGFWLFTGSYYRAYSLFVAFFVLYYSLQALESIIQTKKINMPLLAITLVVLTGLLHYPFFDEKKIPDHSIVLFVTIMLAAYSVVFYFIFKRNATYLKYLFLAMVVFEVAYLSNITVSNMDAVPVAELSQHTGYNDNTKGVVDHIKQFDNSFYRIDKSYSSSPSYYPSYNDGMLQGYYGTSSYNPFNQVYYIHYLQLMGVSNKADETESRWAVGLTGRPILESENRVKYILTRTTYNPMPGINLDSLHTPDGVKYFRNNFVLPLGFTYGYYIKESVFTNLSTSQKDLVSLRACVLGDAAVSKTIGLKEFMSHDTIAISGFNDTLYQQYVNELKKDTLTTVTFNEQLVSGHIHVSGDKMMYLSIPYDRGWQLRIDGKETEKVILDGGMTGVMLTRGKHTIEMSYGLPYIGAEILLSILGLLCYAGLCIYKTKKG